MDHRPSEPEAELPREHTQVSRAREGHEIMRASQEENDRQKPLMRHLVYGFKYSRHRAGRAS